jgi:hypothetical protein
MDGAPAPAEDIMKFEADLRSWLFKLIAPCTAAALTTGGCDKQSESQGAGTSIEVNQRAVGTMPDTFEIEGTIGRERVRVTAEFENPYSVALRARQMAVGNAALKPRAIGVRIFVIYPEAQLGAAFASSTSIYHLLPGRLSIDETYFYCDGFVSETVLAISKKTRFISCQTGESEIARLLSLAESVRSGSGYEAVIWATEGSGWISLIKSTGTSEEHPIREESWFAGPQRIEQECLKLSRSARFGNEVEVEFCPCD